MSQKSYLERNGYVPSTADHAARTGAVEAQTLVNAIIPHLSLLNGPPAPDIDMWAYEAGEFGAHVVRLDESHQYGISIAEGVTLLLRDAFYRLLSHRENFTEIGDVDKEVISGPTVLNLYTHADDLTKFGVEGEYSIPVPKCDVRQRYAELLTRIAVIGIVLHELGHVVQGHLRLPEQQRSSPQDSRSLEASADRYGAAKMVQCFFAAGTEQRNAEFLHDEEAGLIAHLRAMYVVHLFDEAAHYPTGTIGERSHPLPRHRQISVGYSANVAYEKIKGKGARINRLINQVSGECEAAYRRIIEHPADIEYALQCFRGDIADDGLLKHWQINLRPALLNLTYTDLPTAGPGPDDSVYE